MIELLVVIAIMGILITFATPSLRNALRTSSEGAAIVSLQGTLESARSRAIGGNRWVWVGIQPGSNGITRFFLGSRDGTREPTSSEEVIALGNPTLIEGVSLSEVAEFPSNPRPAADRIVPQNGGWIIFSPEGEARFAENPQLDLPRHVGGFNPGIDFITEVQISLIDTHLLNDGRLGA